MKLNQDKMEEECGVFGMLDKAGNNVAFQSYFGLFALQHRGQESAGVVLSDGEQIRYHRGMGLVTDVFSGSALEDLGKGHICAGHVRYSTTGNSVSENAQPLVFQCQKGTMAIAHNGNLVNMQTLRADLAKQGAIFQSTVDTEVIANLIARIPQGDLAEGLADVMKKLCGSYALVAMLKDKLIGMRDPNGIRPLCLGKTETAYVLASETCAFDAVGARYIRDIAPGEILIIDQNGLSSSHIPAAEKSSVCIFEYVYFARADSVMEGISIYKARKNMGSQLALEYPVEADMVMGIPDSGTTAAIGYAETSGIPFGEGLMKNRYVGRTFIQPDQLMRERAVQMKLNAIRETVSGKRVVLIDDSIVRGTTSKKIIAMMRDAGAREIHVRVSSPPVTHPCFFGIDTPSQIQLIGAGKTQKEICKWIGADTLGYLSLEGLIKSVEGESCGFCHGCFHGKYPIKVSDEHMNIAAKQEFKLV